MTGRGWWTTERVDLVGHGTACAGIIHAIAPAADLVSIRVLGADNRGAGPAFAAAIEWAIAPGVRRRQPQPVIAQRGDGRTVPRAGRRGVLRQHAARVGRQQRRRARPIPSLFAAVVSVAAHDAGDPDVWFYNPAPPVEFGAHGLDVDVAWRGGTRIRATGNSFAAPHLAGRAALIRARYPDASPFEVKAMLAATASDPRSDLDPPDMKTPPGRSGRCLAGCMPPNRISGARSPRRRRSAAPRRRGRSPLHEVGRRRRQREPVALDVVADVDELLAGRPSRGSTKPSFGSWIRLFAIACVPLPPC